jgi:type IV pilus assembly protein PilM
MIRAAEVEMSGRAQGTILKYAEAPMPSGAVVDGDVNDSGATANLIKSLWTQGGFTTKDVIVGVGSARTVVREMQVSEMPMDQLRKSLPFQVEEFLPSSTDEMLIDFYPTAEVEGERIPNLRGILVAASKQSVSNTVLAVESGGLKLKGVDLKAFALTRALITPELAGATVALVDIGARITTVSIVEHGAPRLIRMLTSGGLDVTNAVATAAQLPQPEAEELKRRVGIASPAESGSQAIADALMSTSKTLVDSIRNTLVYYTSNNPGSGIQHTVLTGGGAMMPGLGQALASAVRLPVSFGNGVGALKTSKKAQMTYQGRETLIAVPVGLAMGEVTS